MIVLRSNKSSLILLQVLKELFRVLCSFLDAVAVFGHPTPPHYSSQHYHFFVIMTIMQVIHFIWTYVFCFKPLPLARFFVFLFVNPCPHGVTFIQWYAEHV